LPLPGNGLNFIAMIKRFVLIITLFLGCTIQSIQAQKHDYIWLPGKGKIAEYPFSGVYYPWGGITMDFNQQFPPTTERRNLALIMYAQAIISDKNGSLVAYTNGCHIINKKDEIMDNGDTINPGLYHTGTQQCRIYYPAYQGTIFLPAPGSDSLYYLFHMGLNILDTFPWFVSQRFYYSQLDASANNGLGRVIDKNHLLYENGAIAPYVTATKHANGRDWWVVTTQRFTNNYYVFLVDPSGPKFVHQQEIGEPMSRGSQCCGQTGFSPDGNKHFNASHNTGLQLLDFDRCTGYFSNPVFIDSSEVGKFGPAGVAISKNSQFVYVSTSKYVYQFDLTANDILSSKVFLDSVDWIANPEIGTFLDQMLAPDGKIYMVSLNYIQDMPVIQFPERKGLACKVEQHGFKLPALYGNDFIFNFPHYRVGPVDGSSCDTLGIDNMPLAEFRWDFEDTLTPLQVTFTEACSYEPEAWHWDFGDGTSSEERYPVHEYNSSGVYEVCLIVSNANGADTLCKTLYLGVSALENPQVQTGISVFPNPFEEVLGVSIAVDIKPLRFFLYDQFGRLLHQMETGIGINEVPTGRFPPGMYYWEVRSGELRIRSGKLVKH
jgi:PKD repeat protein